jgi:hypothetical protein
MGIPLTAAYAVVVVPLSALGDRNLGTGTDSSWQGTPGFQVIETFNRSITAASAYLAVPPQPIVVGVFGVDVAGHEVAAWAGVVVPYAPPPQILPNGRVNDGTVIGGLPLIATWDGSLCSCYNGCEFFARVRSADSGGEDGLMLPEVPLGQNSMLNTSRLMLVDGATLFVDVRCVDAVNRSTEWVTSDGVLVVLSRTLSVASDRHIEKAVVDVHLPAYSSIKVHVNIAPLLVDTITLSVFKVNSSSSSNASPSNRTWEDCNATCSNRAAHPVSPVQCSVDVNTTCLFSSLCFANCSGWDVRSESGLCAPAPAEELTGSPAFNDTQCYTVVNRPGAADGDSLSVVIPLVDTMVLFKGTALSSFVVPAMGPLVQSGDVVHVEVCVADPGARPLCKTLFVGIDDTPPVMAWVHDTLPVVSPGSPFAAANAEHPFTRGRQRDVDYQVDNTAVGCEFGAANDRESGPVQYDMCWTTEPRPPHLTNDALTAVMCNIHHWEAVDRDTQDSALSNTHNSTLEGQLLMLNQKIFCVVRACNLAGLCAYAWSSGVTVVSDFDRPVVAVVRDGLAADDSIISAINWQLGANWDFAALAVPVFRSNLSVVAVTGDPSVPPLDGIPLRTSRPVIGGPVSVYNDTTGGVAGMDLVHGSRYSMCVVAINMAGVASMEVCSPGVTMGQVAWPLDPVQGANILLSNIPFSMFSTSTDSGEGWTSQEDNFTTALISISVPPMAVPQQETLDAQTTLENVGGSHPRRNLVFGGYGFSADIASSPHGYSFQRPLEVTVLCPSSGNAVLDANRVPTLQVVLNGTWTSAEDTCAPVAQSDGTVAAPSSRYNRDTRELKVRICHFTEYALWYQLTPVAVISPLPVVQLPSEGAVASVTLNGSLSHDQDTREQLVRFTWVVFSGQVQVFAGEGPIVTVPSLSAGEYVVNLRVEDRDGSMGHASATLVVNVQPAASVTATQPASLPSLDTPHIIPVVTSPILLQATGTQDAEDPLEALRFAWLHVLSLNASHTPLPGEYEVVDPWDPRPTVRVSASGAPGLFAAMPVSPGWHWFAVRVEDSLGGASVAYVPNPSYTAATVFAGVDVAVPYPASSAVLTGVGVSIMDSLVFPVTGCGTWSLVNTSTDYSPTPSVRPGDLLSNSTACQLTAHISDVPLSSQWWHFRFTVTLLSSGSEGAPGPLELSSIVRVRVNRAPEVQTSVSPAAVVVLPALAAIVSVNGSWDDEATGAGGLVSTSWTVTPAWCVDSATPEAPDSCSQQTYQVVHADDRRGFVQRYLPMWATPVTVTFTGPGSYRMTAVTSDAHGASSVPRVVVVSAQWPALEAFIEDAATLVAPQSQARVVVSWNNTSSELAALLWMWNRTEWSVTGPQGDRLPNTCGNSSVCWLHGLHAPGTYVVTVTVRLMNDTSGSPWASHSCDSCVYRASTALRKYGPSLVVEPRVVGTGLGEEGHGAVGPGVLLNVSNTRGSDWEDLRDLVFTWSVVEPSRAAVVQLPGTKSVLVQGACVNRPLVVQGAVVDALGGLDSVIVNVTFSGAVTVVVVGVQGGSASISPGRGLVTNASLGVTVATAGFATPLGAATVVCQVSEGAPPSGAVRGHVTAVLPSSTQPSHEYHLLSTVEGLAANTEYMCTVSVELGGFQPLAHQTAVVVAPPVCLPGEHSSAVTGTPCLTLAACCLACPAGHVCPDGQLSVPCPAGTYRAGVGGKDPVADCTACPSGRHSAVAGAVTLADCGLYSQSRPDVPYLWLVVGCGALLAVVIPAAYFFVRRRHRRNVLGQGTDSGKAALPGVGQPGLRKPRRVHPGDIDTGHPTRTPTHPVGCDIAVPITPVGDSRASPLSVDQPEVPITPQRTSAGRASLYSANRVLPVEVVGDARALVPSLRHGEPQHEAQGINADLGEPRGHTVSPDPGRWTSSSSSSIAPAPMEELPGPQPALAASPSATVDGRGTPSRELSTPRGNTPHSGRGAGSTPTPLLSVLAVVCAVGLCLASSGTSRTSMSAPVCSNSWYFYQDTSGE